MIAGWVVADLDRALERARAQRFGGRPTSWGLSVERAHHEAALQSLTAAACALAGAGDPELGRRMTKACADAIAVGGAPTVDGSLAGLLEAVERLDGALRAELARLRREAA